MRLISSMALGACALAVAGSAGCTNSDVLSTGSAGFEVQVELVNPDSRFTNSTSPLETAAFQVSQIGVRPNDPVADQSLGPLPIGIISEASQVIRVNLKSVGDIQPSSLILSTGSYRIDRVQLANLNFQDVDYFTSTPHPTNCRELGAYQASIAIDIVPAQFGAEVNFVVSEDTPAVTVFLDGAALTEAFISSFDCSLPADTFSQLQEDKFRQADFVAKAPTYIRVAQ